MESYLLVLQSPGPVIMQVGAFTLRWYGLLIAIAVIIGLNLSNKLPLKKGLQKEP